MEIVTVRDCWDELSTEGKLYVNGVYECETLEDTDRHLESKLTQKVPGRTAIPRGKYELVVDYSPHFARNLPHILNVPDFEGIRIHPGNNPADTEGCLLVGQTRGHDFIYSSVVAFELLMAKIQFAFDAGERITYEVK